MSGGQRLSDTGGLYRLDPNMANGRRLLLAYRKPHRLSSLLKSINGDRFPLV